MKTLHHFYMYLRPEPEGGYTVSVPALPGCVTYGETVDEARKMATDAISAYLVSMEKHGETPVTDDQTILMSVGIPIQA